MPRSKVWKDYSASQRCESSLIADCDVLAAFLADELPAGAIAGVRPIQKEDANLLTAAETLSIAKTFEPAKRASGAARHLARHLCRTLGLEVHDLLKSPTGAPAWPREVVGSLSHDATIVVATVAKSDVLKGLGIDIDSSELLETEVANRVATEQERQEFQSHPSSAKALFCIKEAVFKAVYPQDGIFLEFHDVTVDQATRTAKTTYGRIVQWRVLTQPRVAALAWWA